VLLELAHWTYFLPDQNKENVTSSDFGITDGKEIINGFCKQTDTCFFEM